MILKPFASLLVITRFGLQKWDAYDAIQQIYKVVPQMPWEVEDEIWRASLAKATDIMAPVLTSNTPTNLVKRM